MLSDSDTFSSLFYVRASERNMSRHVQYAQNASVQQVHVRIFCVHVSVKWTLIPHLWHHIWLNFDGKNLKIAAKVAQSLSYNLSKVEEASIFLHEIKNILVGPGPELNSYSHGLNRVGISDCNLGCLLYTSPSPRD